GDFSVHEPNFEPKIDSVGTIQQRPCDNVVDIISEHVDLFKPALEFLSESDIPAEESLDKFLGCIFPNKDKQQEEYENVDETPLQANQEENLEEDEKSGIDGLSEASVQQLEEDYVEEDAGEGAVQQLEDDYVEVD